MFKIDKIGKDVKEEIIADYLRGRTPNQIEANTRVPRKTIYDILDEAGIERRHRKSAVLQCKYCGESLKNNMNFCPNCGKAVKTEERRALDELTRLIRSNYSIIPSDNGDRMIQLINILSKVIK